MFLRIIFRDRCKGIQPDMKGKVGQLNALTLQLLQQARCEMQTRCRRGGGAWFTGIDGLIAFGVFERLMNIGRQGDIPDLREPGFNGFSKSNEPL